MGLKYLKSVATLKLTAGKCTACGICLDVCPHGVLSIETDEVAIVDLDLCIECGACVINCPFDALSLGRTGPGCAKAFIKGLGKKKEGTCGKSMAPDAPSCCAK